MARLGPARRSALGARRSTLGARRLALGARLGSALGAAGRDKRVLLLDVSRLVRPDDVSNLLVTPKGWLCTLEHKSCQMAC